MLYVALAVVFAAMTKREITLFFIGLSPAVLHPIRRKCMQQRILCFHPKYTVCF